MSLRRRFFLGYQEDERSWRYICCHGFDFRFISAVHLSIGDLST